MNLIDSICSAVAAATGRGFKSRRPDFLNRWRSPAPLKTRKTSTAFLAAALVFLCATSSDTDSDHKKLGGFKLNTTALTYAKQLISQGHVVIDRKGAWAKDRPSTELENEFIRQHGFGEYAKWYLGIDDRYAENTKRRYKFPYGDFKDIHRCGLLAVKARASQYGHAEIENAAAQLLEIFDWGQGRAAEQPKR
jgi:hypothetical protein